MKKELDRFFGDRRMVFSILMPGILIYVMYCFMGVAMGDAFGVDEDYTPTVRAAGLPASMEALLQQTGFAVTAGEDGGHGSGGRPGAGPAGGVPGGL